MHCPFPVVRIRAHHSRCSQHSRSQQGSACSITSRAFSRKQHCHQSRLHATPVPQPTADVNTDRRHSTPNLSTATTLVEFHDHHKTTYSWQGTSSQHNSTAVSSNGTQIASPISVLDERYEAEEEQKSIWSTFSGGQQLIEGIKRLYLPAGYPDTVTDDYLVRQLGAGAAFMTAVCHVGMSCLDAAMQAYAPISLVKR